MREEGWKKREIANQWNSLRCVRWTKGTAGDGDSRRSLLKEDDCREKLEDEASLGLKNANRKFCVARWGEGDTVITETRVKTKWQGFGFTESILNRQGGLIRQPGSHLSCAEMTFPVSYEVRYVDISLMFRNLCHGPPTDTDTPGDRKQASHGSFGGYSCPEID
ncbi:hypothetical protein K0M31_010133 [Melipona bicolor]|uniref:Uncharacterized protein n=1 Tax=Melipona bicolor TaxID=60889 RepID=A0AA40FMX4_9HYME|nr:hypothetical protein K0M31_010133 [Melipona bicolor]